MSKRSISWILVAGLFFVTVMIGAAQTTAHSPVSPSPQAPNAKAASNHSAVESNPACQRIVSECKKVGFIQGQWKKDNGLWKDCFNPIVKGGGSPTRDGKPINVPVNPSDVQACRTVAEGHRKATP